MFDWALNTPLTSLGYINYLAISMIIATLASYDQVIFEISSYVLFQCACVCFVKFETEFREIIHSRSLQVTCLNEITCLNERIFFSYILFIFFFRFIINCIKALMRITIMEMTTLKLPFSYNGKARRLCRNDGCNVSSWRLLMRRCNDVVFATSSGASIATIWRWWMAKSQQRCNDVILSTGNLQTIHIYQS